MCGICGFFGFGDKALLKDMCSIAGYRGPDNEGLLSDAGMGLGYRRLSIIDTKEQKQPILHNSDGTRWIALNGEIYNYKPLRAYLEYKGHKFYTNTDTEVVLHLYDELGEKCLEMLRGMFAFAIWDSKQKSFFIARDGVGIKPLYYYANDGSFVFASEIKQLLLAMPGGFTVDNRSLHYLMSIGHSPRDFGLISGVKKLPAGHYMLVSKKGVDIKRYWRLEMNPSDSKSDDYNIKRFREQLQDSVESELISDVPLGAYLSGGIDSSSIVALMSQVTNQPVKTFSAGVWGPQSSDLQNARIVAEHLGTDHHELIVESDTLNLLPRIIWHLDEPVWNPTVMPLFLLSEMASKHCKVVLTGDGADEIVAGYKRYGQMLKFESKYAKKIPSFAKTGLTKKAIMLAPIKKSTKNRLVFAAEKDAGARYYSLVTQFQDLDGVYSESFSKQVSKTNILKENISPYFTTSGSELNQMLAYDFENYMVENFLLITDRTTMAHSIEGRVPFLDTKTAELAASLPPAIKLHNGVEKYVLRQSVKDLLPKEIVERKKKGFVVPLGRWMNKEMLDLAKDLLSEENVRKRDHCKYGFVKKLLSHNYTESKADNQYAAMLFKLMAIELWQRIFIDGDYWKNPNKLEKII